MKQNRIITIEIIISIFLLICTLTHITHYKYITAALIVLITTITSKLIKNNTTQKPNTKKIVGIVTTFAIVYVALYYTLGMYVGFAHSTTKLSIETILKYIVPITIIIIGEELLRNRLLVEKAKKSKILIIIIGTIIDISIYQGLYNLKNLEGFLAFIGLILFTSIANNIFYTYISDDYGPKPVITYKLITMLYPYIFPIVPQVYTYFRIFIRLLYPLIMYLYIDKYFDLDNYQLSKKENRRQIISTTIISAMMIIVICLVSCKFILGVLVIGSKSMSGSIEKGDVILYKTEKKDIRDGDIIVFKRDNIRIVHRVISIKNINNEIRYYTKGDANKIKDEGYVTEKNLIGKVKYKIKYIGIPSLWIREKFE